MKKMNISFSPPDITETEINNVVDVLKSGWITTGPKTKFLETKLAKFVGTNKFVTMNSATACMEMTLRLLEIGPGDEVITSAYTYTASASVIDHVGATIVLVDTQKDSFEMDYDKLAEAITDKTKAVIPVDLAGAMIDYNQLYAALESKKELYTPKENTLQEKFERVVVIGDSAHALGASRDGLNAGQVADFTSYSFHAVKNFTTAEGGAVTWKTIPNVDDEEIYQSFMRLILHGQTKDALSKTKAGAWEYDIVAPYFKANMTDINAAIGLAQLERYPQLLKRRQEIIEKYNQGLKDIAVTPLCHYTENAKSSGHLYIMNVDGYDLEQRNNLIIQLAERGISANVHYKPLPLLTAYMNLGFKMEDYPNAYNMYKNEVTLPLHTLLKDEEIEYVIDNVKNILKNG